MMFEYLRIQDLALIADMELEFTNGMNVLTGETGAGKSFILKAINFLMGDKLGVEMVRQGKDRAQIEAIFLHPEKGEIILRRELSAITGRSRFYLNDTLRSSDTIKELRSQLLTHTSQHGQQKLLQPSFQETLLDTWINQPELFIQKAKLVSHIKALLEEHSAVHTRLQKIEERRDLLELYLQDINKVNPLPNEDEQLENIKEQLRATTSLQKKYVSLLAWLQREDVSIISELTILERYIASLNSINEEYTIYLDTIAEFKHQLIELEKKLKQDSLVNKQDIDIEQIEARLFELSQLKRKFHRSLPEIFSLKEEIEKDLSLLDSSKLDIRQHEKEQQVFFESLQQVLKDINTLRERAAKQICDLLKVELVELGFSEHVEVVIEFIPYELFPGCIENKIRILWAPNPGHPPYPLERIASGGELSRFLLALVSIYTSEDGGMLIFDEIDAGVGGHTLQKVADKLAHLSTQKQLLVITHWPQLAVKASRHFQIVKEVNNGITYTRCKQLTESEKQQELSRMSGTDTV